MQVLQEKCPWLSTKCPVTNCKGIRLLKMVTTSPNTGEKYLQCQFRTCPSFQWLKEAQGGASGYVGSLQTLLILRHLLALFVDMKVIGPIVAHGRRPLVPEVDALEQDMSVRPQQMPSMERSS